MRGLLYFNSTMVRLKGNNYEGAVAELVNFNSTMVRLKASTKLKAFPFLSNFNSTMVRLKDTDAELKAKRLEFQFHYGSVKRWELGEECITKIYFNSTMVRLKD